MKRTLQILANSNKEISLEQLEFFFPRYILSQVKAQAKILGFIVTTDNYRR